MKDLSQCQMMSFHPPFNKGLFISFDYCMSKLIYSFEDSSSKNFFISKIVYYNVSIQIGKIFLINFLTLCSSFIKILRKKWLDKWLKQFYTDFFYLNIFFSLFLKVCCCLGKRLNVKRGFFNVDSNTWINNINYVPI